MVGREQKQFRAARDAPSENRHGVAKDFFVVIFLFMGLLMLPYLSDSAELSRAAEYEIKAAFLYKFIRFTEWPSEKPADYFVIGVLGKDPFGPVLDRLLDGELIDQKKIVAKRFTRIEDAAESHILFISSSEQEDLPRILQILERDNVLSVGDMNNFAQRGGIIALKRENNRIIFEINMDAAKRAKLTLSSQLLALARIIKDNF